MKIPEYDFASISPVMARERFAGNYEAAILSLAKKTMEQNASAILELMDSAPVASAGTEVSSAIDIKL